MVEMCKHTEHGLFADDTALWSSSNTIKNLSSRLQQSVEEFQRWCDAWKLTIQPTKTEMIYFSPHPRKNYKTQLIIKVNNVIIKPQQSARYLGIIFDHKLDWRMHIRKVETKTASRIGLLRFLSRSSPNSNEKIMINIFKSLIRTVLTYGYPVLLSANNKIWNRLQITQNKAIRAALGIPPYTSVEFVHQESNIPRIRDYAKILLERSVVRAQLQNDEQFEKLLRDTLNNL